MDEKSKVDEIIKKQLSMWSKTKKLTRMAYHESTPLKQIQMDTMFWKVVRGKGAADIPILVIVDVATRFTGYFIQNTKNDSVRDHLETFIERVKTHFPQTADKMLLITDGAKELAVKGVPGLKHKVSKGLNKAVLAEVKIRQARAILRDVELDMDLENLSNDRETRIDRKNLKGIFKKIEQQVNAKAKIREPKDYPQTPQDFDVGDPVLALNLHKFFPFQIGETLRKRSYDRNWYTEPFYISKVHKFQGIYKYTLSSYIGDEPLKYTFYPDQLQHLDRRIAFQYVQNYVNFMRKREGTDFFENSK